MEEATYEECAEYAKAYPFPEGTQYLAGERYTNLPWWQDDGANNLQYNHQRVWYKSVPRTKYLPFMKHIPLEFIIDQFLEKEKRDVRN